MSDSKAPGQAELPLIGDDDASPVSYRFSRDREAVRRSVKLVGGETHTTVQSVNGSPRTADAHEMFDRAWLDAPDKPQYGRSRQRELRVADLFCGAGGMTLGAMEAGRAVGVKVTPVLGVDFDAAVRGAYTENFNPEHFESGDIAELVDGELGSPPTPSEAALIERVGGIDLLMGGPPCQGHSNLNNHTRRADPKNALYARMARVAELFKPDHIIIENVHGALHDRSRVLQATEAHLQLPGLEYNTSVGIVHGERIGIPQTRHRVFLIASRTRDLSLPRIEKAHAVEEGRSFDWACAGLTSVPDHPLDRETVQAPVTKERIAYLFDGRDDDGEEIYELPDSERPTCHREKKHSYVSVYGRIKPWKPAPTITTGFTVMGQGRFVHPHERRTLTPREGARLQFFPNWFSFGDVDSLTRKELVSLIGNAVPPKMAYVLALELVR